MAPLNGASLLLCELVLNISGSNEYLTVENLRVRGHPGLSSRPHPMQAAKPQLFTQLLLGLLFIHPPFSSFSATTPLQIITVSHPDDFNSPADSLNQFPPFPTPFFPQQPECSFKNANLGASLVVQWLRIHLPMQGTRV